VLLDVLVDIPHMSKPESGNLCPCLLEGVTTPIGVVHEILESLPRDRDALALEIMGMLEPESLRRGL
jgi:hypothetical protein